jgi:hypothetical protein
MQKYTYIERGGESDKDRERKFNGGNRFMIGFVDTLVMLNCKRAWVIALYIYRYIKDCYISICLKIII